MSASITVSTTFDTANRYITCTVNSGADIPHDIFLYENNNGTPGSFFAVCALSDWQRFPTYTGSPIPVFGNKYLKTTQGMKSVPIAEDYSTIEPMFVSNCQAFRNAYLGFVTPSSKTYSL